MGIKLVKVSERPVEVWSGSYGPVDRVERTYKVVLDSRLLGYVVGRWGVDYPGERSKVSSFWEAYGPEADPDNSRDDFLGYRDYRNDAVTIVVSKSGEKS